MMKPNAYCPRAVAESVSAGAIQSRIAAVADFRRLITAIERDKLGHAPGKTVLVMTL